MKRDQAASLITTGVRSQGEVDGVKVRGASASPGTPLPPPRIERIKITSVDSSSPPIYSGLILQGRNNPTGGNPGGSSTGIPVSGIQSLNATAQQLVNDVVFVLLHPTQPPFIISGGGSSSGLGVGWFNVLQVTAAGAEE